MKKQGTVVRWEGERAFGFIRSPDTTADIFFHVRDFTAHVTPREGMAVSFEEIHVGGKGPRALSVAPITNTIVTPPDEPKPEAAALLPKGRTAPRSQAPHLKKREDQLIWLALGLMALWLLLWLVGIGMGRFRWIVLTGVAMLNLVTFYMYWRDKEAAVENDWRTNEQTLHLLGALGGWPGAWFAQQILRHKTKKLTFRAVYWATVGVNFAALLGWIIWPWVSGQA